MIVHRAFAPALGAASRAYPLEPNVNTLALQIELRFDDLPGVFDAEELTQEFGVAHTAPSTSTRYAPLAPPTTSPEAPIDEWVVESGDREHRRTSLLSPTPSATLSGEAQGAFDPALFAFESLFAEGLRAESPFYRFLCFYNVLEKLIEVVNPRLKSLLEQNNLQYEPLNGTVPAILFEKIAPDYVNEKFTSLKVKVQKPYRNSIAHFNLESRIRPFDLGAKIDVRTAAIVLTYAADMLLEIARRNISRLRTTGVAFDFVDDGST